MREFIDKLSASVIEIVYIAPHLDDAALGAGATLRSIAKLGRDVSVVTVFCGEPDGIQNNVQERKKEDLLACKELGITATHLGFLDAIYRRDKYGKHIYPYLSAVVEEPAKEDTLLSELGYALSSFLKEKVVIVPAGRSRHVDHQILRKVCDEYLEPFAYYDDLPYFARSSIALVSFNPNMPENAVSVQVDEDALKAKIRAVKKYMSQLEFLFGSNDEVGNIITAYLNSTGGEVHWIK